MSNSPAPPGGAPPGNAGAGATALSLILGFAVLLLCAWPVFASIRGSPGPELRTLGGLVLAIGAFSSLNAMTRSSGVEGFSVRSHWGGLGGGLGGWTFSRPLAFALIGIALATAAAATLVPPDPATLAVGS